MNSKSQREKFEDLLNETEIKDFLHRAETEMLPQMAQSVLCVTIFSKSAPDIKQCLEVGAALLFGKPLILTVPQGAVIPENLRKVAAEIVEIDDYGDPEAMRKLQAAIQRVVP